MPGRAYGMAYAGRRVMYECRGRQDAESGITEPRVIAAILAHLETRIARAPPPARHRRHVVLDVAYGQGRVFATVLGHTAKNLENEGFQIIFARGAEWAATGAVTIPVPADFPTAETSSARDPHAPPPARHSRHPLARSSSLVRLRCCARVAHGRAPVSPAAGPRRCECRHRHRVSVCRPASRPASARDIRADFATSRYRCRFPKRASVRPTRPTARAVSPSCRGTRWRSGASRRTHTPATPAAGLSARPAKTGSRHSRPARR